MKKSIYWITAAVVVVIVLIISLSRNQSETQGSIKIGVVLPLTGIAASYGENQSNAIRMAIDEINSGGGLLGQKLEMILEDDATDPKKTISAYQKLTDVDKVSVVIGADWDLMANAIIPLVSNKKVVVISPSAYPDVLERTDPYFFTTAAPVSAGQPTIEQYLRNEPGTKVVLMATEGGWGHANRETYRKAALATGKTIVYESKLPKYDNNDLQREISILKGYKPDIILAAVNLIDAKLLVEKNVQLGLNAKILGTQNIETTSLDSGIDKNALKGVVAYKLAPPQSQFVAKYTKTFGKGPISDADKAYDAMGVVARAIEISKDSSSTGISAGLKRISDFKGVASAIDYTKANWPTANTTRLIKFDGTNWASYLAK